VNGKTILNQGLTTNNHDINAGTGKVTASNVIYGLKAGTGITISGGQTPTISATASSSGVLSLQGSTGALQLAAGSDISISGLNIADTSTLATVVARGGCSGCVTNSDLATVGTGAGGTNITSYTKGDILYANDTNTLSTLSI